MAERQESEVPLVAESQETPASPTATAGLLEEDGSPQEGRLGACDSSRRGGGAAAALLCVAVGGACAYYARHGLREAGFSRAGPLRHLEGDKQVDWLQATWVKGGSGENCEDACERRGLSCYQSEDTWPQTKEDTFKIAEGLGMECQHGVSAENTYDPFVVGPFCSFGPWKPPNVWGPWRPTNVRSCKAAPPVATTRLCSCVKEIPQKQCHECDPNCWQSDSCCKDEDDKCAADPLRDEKHPDEQWWGSATNWEWGGVEKDAECMQGHPDSPEELPELWEATTKQTDPLQIKVLSYNLFWWNLFGEKGGSDGAAGKLVGNTSKKVPYDLMGFQECEDLKWVLGDAKLEDKYGKYEINERAICIAWKSSVWSKLDKGYEVVGNDGGWVKGNKWGDRVAAWVRLEHKKTGDKLFFVNHHGPLPLNSGGECGGLATAYNILSVIKANAKKGDILVMVGDFNSDFNSATIKLLGSRIHLGYHGKSFGGIDNIFANSGIGTFVKKENLGNGTSYGGAGSDHDAISATFKVAPAFTTSSTPEPIVMPQAPAAVAPAPSGYVAPVTVQAGQGGGEIGLDSEWEGDEQGGLVSMPMLPPAPAPTLQMPQEQGGMTLWPFWR